MARKIVVTGLCGMLIFAPRIDPSQERVIPMQPSYNGIPVPAHGQPIEYSDGKYKVPDHPIIPFIEGDGTGRDIWRASQRVFDAAVEKAYGGKLSVQWYEVLAGGKADRQ